MIEEPSRTFAPALLSAWQDEKATPNPSIKQQCLEREPELLPRFAEQYQMRSSAQSRLSPQPIG
ncbi:MAG TPA: hypothetical protein VKB96_18615 [Gammaproteobacteria bacterium]|jgi:hypothetical protein|nr:hypothetical protein [Gammaproteobacteria bacterium]